MATTETPTCARMPLKLARFRNILNLSQLFRELTPLETDKLCIYCNLCCPLGKAPGVDEVMLFNNFGITESGALDGYVAIYNKNATVHRDPFPHNMYRTKALHEITDAYITGKEVTADSLRTPQRQNVTKKCVVNALDDTQKGYCVTTSSTATNKFDDASCTAELGVGGTCTAGTAYYIEKERSMKQRLFVFSDTCQSKLAEQASAHIANASRQGVTFDVLFNSQTLSVDGVNSAAFFKLAKVVAARAADAISVSIQEALCVSFVRPAEKDLNSVDGGKVVHADAYTTENCFYDGPNEDQVSFYCGVQKTTAAATAIFTDLAMNGLFIISGPKGRSQYASKTTSLFDGTPWQSADTFDGIPSDIGRRLRLGQIDPAEFRISNLSEEEQQMVKRHFVFDGDGDGDGDGDSDGEPDAEPINHMFCQRLFVGDASEESLLALESVTEFALSRCHEGDRPMLRFTRLIPICMQVNTTRKCDLRLAPGDSFGEDNDEVA